jgi:hypothetical protein
LGGLNATQGGGGKLLLPVGFAEVSEVVEVGVEVVGIGVEVVYISGLGEALIPGAHVLADVTASDPAV